MLTYHSLEPPESTWVRGLWVAKIKDFFHSLHVHVTGDPTLNVPSGRDLTICTFTSWSL